MKFPRNARLLRSQLDVTPFAAVFFLLVMLVMLGSLVYTPGLPLNLPVATDLPGTDKPSVAVAVDAEGRFYFQNQMLDAEALEVRLRATAQAAPEPLTLVVMADKAVTYESLVRLSLLARKAGLLDAHLAVLPREIGARDERAAKP